MNIATDPISNFGLDCSDYRALLMCGNCATPVAYHDEDGYVTVDDRYCTPRMDFPRSGFDYYLHSAQGDVTVYEDYSGNPANIEALVDGVEYDGTTYRIEDSIESYDNGSEYADAIARWSDRDPGVCTHAAHYWYVNMNTGEVVDPTPYGKRRMPNDFVETYEDRSDRNAYVEGLDGFTAQHFLDPEKTAKFHARLFNSFTHKKSGKFHVGSLALEINKAMNTVTATCINRECNVKQADGNYRPSSLTISLDVERYEMEDFIYQVIRHGNNHGPAFIRTRPDFYKLHFFDCDLECGDGITCNHNQPITNDTDLTDVEFVLEHQAWCSDKNCGCSEWLANEIPAFRTSKESEIAA